VVSYSDDFNRADGPPGAAWQDTGGSNTSYSIVSNRLVRQTVSDWIEYLTMLPTADHFVEADVIGANSNFVVVHARSTGIGQTCYMAFLTPGGGCEIGKNTGFFSYGTVINKAFTHGDAHRLRLEVQGTQQRLYVDGVLELTGNDTTVTTGVNTGLNSNTAGSAFDNFSTGDIVAGTNLTVANGAHLHAAEALTLTTDTAGVITSNTEIGTSLGTSNAIPAPAGVTSGDLLLAFCSNDAPSATITASAGWPEINQQVITGNVHRMAVFGRIADGGANDALSLSGTAQDYCAGILRVVNHGVASVTSDIKVAGTFNATAGAINPPSLAAGSSQAWLWLSSGCVDMTNAGDTLTTSPTNYTQVINLKSASSTTSSGMAVSSRGLTTSTEDPGAYTNTSRPWIGITLAIPPFVPAVTLTVNNAAHLHSADNVVLSPVLVVADAAHAVTSDVVVLYPVPDLAVADGLHLHAADNVILTFDLVVADGAHLHSAESVILVPDLIVADGQHLHAADNVVLVPVFDLIVADCAHLHAAESVDLVQNYVLTVADCLHGHTADEVAIDLPGTLGVANCHHALTSDNVVLEVGVETLTVADGLHGHTAEAVVLSVGPAVADCLHAHSADNVVLYAVPDLAVADCHHGHSASDVVLTTGGVPILVDDCLHAHSADSLVLIDNPNLVVTDCFHGHTATGALVFPPDSAPGEVDSLVVVDVVETTIVVDEVDMIVFVDAVDVTVIGGNP
jgi:hypothetical protein